MANESISPEKVTRPYQLLAASFVALMAIDTAFLTAAGLLKVPSWLPALLVIAAVANVPIFLISAIVLQTRFRPEMQDDAFYSTYIHQKQEADGVATKLQTALTEAGVDIQALVSRNPLKHSVIPIQVRELLGDLEVAVTKVQTEAAKVGAPRESAYAASELAAGYMAAGEWQKAAAKYLEYLHVTPTDWEAHFARGVALANTRMGTASDLGALREYNEAIALAGESIDGNVRAKLMTYRGAVLKRLGRLDEAESDLLLGQKLATSVETVIDNAYNRAAVYAMRGERMKVLDSLRELQKAPDYLALIRSHLNDYFREFSNDKEFISLLGARTA